jgi:hypothetical protein
MTLRYAALNACNYSQTFVDGRNYSKGQKKGPAKSQGLFISFDFKDYRTNF